MNSCQNTVYMILSSEKVATRKFDLKVESFGSNFTGAFTCWSGFPTLANFA